MQIYYANNLNIILSYMAFNYLYLRSIDISRKFELIILFSFQKKKIVQIRFNNNFFFIVLLYFKLSNNNSKLYNIKENYDFLNLFLSKYITPTYVIHLSSIYCRFFLTSFLFPHVRVYSNLDLSMIFRCMTDISAIDRR